MLAMRARVASTAVSPTTVPPETHARSGLVDDVDGLVGQVAVVEVAGCEASRPARASSVNVTPWKLS
jgi:hypothetical protein